MSPASHPLLPPPGARVPPPLCTEQHPGAPGISCGAKPDWCLLLLPLRVLGALRLSTVSLAGQRARTHAHVCVCVCVPPAGICQPQLKIDPGSAPAEGPRCESGWWDTGPLVGREGMPGMVAEGALCGDGVSLGSVPPIFGPSAGADPCTHPKTCPRTVLPHTWGVWCPLLAPTAP